MLQVQGIIQFHGVAEGMGCDLALTPIIGLVLFCGCPFGVESYKGKPKGNHHEGSSMLTHTLLAHSGQQLKIIERYKKVLRFDGTIVSSWNPESTTRGKT